MIEGRHPPKIVPKKPRVGYAASETDVESWKTY
jgi:hypothetical protein